VCIIANHDEATLAVLYHLMAVDNGVRACTDLGPTVIYFVGKAIVAYDQFLRLPVPVNNGKSKRFAGKQSG
jgi:hypothetical protein